MTVINRITDEEIIALNAARKRLCIIERGEYLGFVEYDSGCTKQRWVLDGIVFAETCNADGFRSGFRCLGKALKVLK